MSAQNPVAERRDVIATCIDAAAARPEHSEVSG